jgi:hypothetical protein
MKETLLALLVVALTVTPCRVHAEDASASPHQMTKPDGSLDMDKCAFCHDESFGLQRTKLETCTLCHAETVHSGAREHLRADQAAVKQAMGEAPAGGTVLPLAENGTIYCGTCHLFHDPKVKAESWLAVGWIPPESGLAGAVRTGISARWARLARPEDDKGEVARFARQGTRQLRAPVSDGRLCRQCHWNMP